MTRNLSCSTQCPEGKCRACDLERMGFKEVAPNKLELIENLAAPSPDTPVTFEEASAYTDGFLAGKLAGAADYVDDHAGEPQATIVGRLPALPGYEKLAAILDEALDQAQAGKGKERHASDGVAFHEQPIVAINMLLGSSDGDLYQVAKKLIESKRLPPERRRAERLGAINYIVAAILVDDELDERKNR